MARFPVGMIILIIVTALIFLGLAHRALDRLKLSDRGALLVIAAMIVGSFIDIPISGGRYPVSLNVGGFIVPVALAGYLLFTAGTGKERTRSLLAALVVGAAVYLLGSVTMRGLPEPGGRFEVLDTLWLYPLVAGIIGYLAGRSRRGSFIAATLGLLLYEVGHYIWLVRSGAPTARIALGGAGLFDAVVIAGFFALLLAEVIGETRERLAGGPSSRGKAPELLQALRKPGHDQDQDQEKQD
ncbi:DUF1614 domain-containing protein [Desulfurispora thermophila]|uniref:DUF1614 domain-containing protein n=1 Tax=Desulfurispora thermophila TaxID=265470 RepID=UPI000377E373|nr:DUF1614 domain-containing protein [Desulfurispora thermophila]